MSLENPGAVTGIRRCALIGHAARPGAHVIAHEVADEIDLVGGETQTRQDLAGDTGADLVVLVKLHLAAGERGGVQFAHVMKLILLRDTPKPQVPTGLMPRLEPLTSSWPPSNRKLLPTFQAMELPLCRPPLPEPGKKCGMLPALQLFAYEMADYLGKDVDQPRNLAKSVTVE